MAPVVQQHSLEAFRAFLREREGSVLRAWLRFFDNDLELRVTALQFANGVRQMGYTGDPQALFLSLDADKSGELALEEIDEDQASLWRRFREWCASNFESARDMLQKLVLQEEGRRRMVSEQVVLPKAWQEVLPRLGWEDTDALDMLFAALDSEDQRQLSLQQLRWLDIEKRRRRRKEQARQRSLEGRRRRMGRDPATVKAALDKFKLFLKRQYGNYIRAWRCLLSPHDQMVVQKVQFFRACSDIGFSSEVKLLWHAFGKDEVGSLSMDELDAKSAVILAHFQVLANKLGGVAATFRALDKHNRKKVSEADFAAAIRSLGFQQPARKLFRGLDRGMNHFLVEDDLRFLQWWKPPAFLVVSPNYQAAEEIKAALLAKYGYFLKSWRRALDQDSSNRCSWDEFQSACRKIGFTGDVAGAWRALDKDMQGFITLRDIDPVSSDTISKFRRWADEEFGSVRSAYLVFDDDGSNSVSSREFRRACRIYGYEGDSSLLFRALDVESSGSLSFDDVAFLDDWEFVDESPDVSDGSPKSWGASSRGGLLRKSSKLSAEDARTSPEPQPAVTVRQQQQQQQQQQQPEPQEAHAPQPQQPPLQQHVERAKTPRHFCPSECERVWWTDVPLRQTSPPPDKPAIVGPMWCSMCRVQCRCRHTVKHVAARSVTPSQWRPSDSLEGGSVANVFPTHLDGQGRADRLRHRRRRDEARAAARRPILPPSKVPPRAASAMGERSFSGDEVRADMEVQLIALSHFPIGTVPAEKVLASARGGAAAPGKLWPTLGGPRGSTPDAIGLTLGAMMPAS